MTARKRSTRTRRARQQLDRAAGFASSIPRERKRSIGVSATAETPLHVRAPGLDLTPEIREDVHSRVSGKLGKFGRDITRISVRFEDLAGPTGAPLIECRFKVVLRNAADVLLSGQGETIRAALTRTLASAERTVRRALEKNDAARKGGRNRR